MRFGFRVDFLITNLERLRRQAQGHVAVAAVNQFHRPRLQHDDVCLAVKNFLVWNLLIRQAQRGLGKHDFYFARQVYFLPAK